MSTSRDLKFLDGLRALAAFWVLTAHCVIWGAGSALFIPPPKLAVNLFMILSGFLMVHSINGHTKDHKWRHFYTRRFFRIAPAYYVALALAVTVPFFLSGYEVLFRQATAARIQWWSNPALIHFSATSILTHLSFVFGLIPSQTDATGLPDWSLSLEMQFYALFPVLWVALKRFGWMTIAAASLVLCAAAHLCVKSVGGLYGGQPFPEASPLPFKLVYFAAGMILYQYAFDGTSSKTDRALMLVGAAVLLLFECRYQGPDAIVESTFLAVFFICLSPTARDTALGAGVRRLLSHKIGRYGSNAAYSVYLFHGFFIALCGALLFTRHDFMSLPGWARIAIMWLITVTGSYALATLVYHFIERPGMRFGAAIIFARPKRAVEVA